MIRKTIPIVLCLCLIISTSIGQTKRKHPRPKRDPLSDIIDGLVPIPPDEILFTKEEADDILSRSGWRKISVGAENADKTVDTIYYDRNRIEHVRGTMRVWLKHQTRKDVETVKSAMLLEEYDCANARSRVLSRTDYDSGSQVTASSSTVGAWRYIVPDTMGESVFGTLCKGLEDEEQRDYRLASMWFGDGRRKEKKGDLDSALFWYKAALEHAPNNSKLTDAIARVNLAKAGRP